MPTPSPHLRAAIAHNIVVSTKQKAPVKDAPPVPSYAARQNPQTHGATGTNSSTPHGLGQPSLPGSFIAR